MNTMVFRIILLVMVLNLILSEEILMANSKDQILRIGVTEIPKVIDPLQNEISTNKITKQVFGSLVKYDKSGNPLPALAKKWTVLRDQMAVRFDLNLEAKFSDGSKLTSEDVRKSLIESIAKGTLLSNLVKNETECGPGKCSAITNDKLSVTVELKEHSYGLFLRAIGGTIASIFKRNGNDYIGTGPYVISKKTSKNLVLTRKESSTDKSIIKEIHIKKIPKEAMKDSFLSGEIDELWAGELTESEVEKTESSVTKISSFATYQFVFNIQSGVFSSPLVREAFMLAIDPAKVLKGHGIDGDIAGGYLPIGLPGHRKDRLKLDLKKAKKLMQSYFKNNKNKKVRFAYRDSLGKGSGYKDYFKEVTESLGLVLEIESMSFRDTLKAIKLKTHDVIFKGDGVQYYDPVTIYVTLMTGNFSNIGGYSNKKFDEIINEAQSTSDLIKKASLLSKAEEIIAKEIPLIPLYYPVTKAYYSKDLMTNMNPKNELWFWEFPYRDFKWKK